MIPSTYRTRGLIFGLLFGPPRFIARAEAQGLYNAIADAIGDDEFSFRYSTNNPQMDPHLPDDPESNGFAINLERRVGKGGLRITLDNANITQPIRLTLNYIWPRSNSMAHDEMNLAVEAVFECLGNGWSKVMAETRVQGQLDAAGGSGVEFLCRRMFGTSDSRLDHLEAPPNFIGLSLETPAGHASADDPLARPTRQLRLEVLREDPRQLYLEAMSQWPQVAMAAQKDGSVHIDASQVRSFDHRPSEYLENAEGYLQERVFPLFEEAS